MKAKPVPPVTDSAPGTAARFVEVAQSQIGVIEGPKDNETEYGVFTKANFAPWCGSFCMWVAKQAKVTIPNTVYTPAGVTAFKSKKAWEDAEEANPKPGDLVYFDFVKGGASVEHVGIVVKDNGDGTVTTVEGNTSPENKKRGSQANGGEVALRTRAYKKNKKGLTPFIVGFGRPKYKGASKPAEKAADKPTKASSESKVCPTCGQSVK